MGLGGYPGVGLKDARDLAARWRKHTKLGDDPIKLRDKERREAAKTDSIFENVALAAFAARKAELKDDGKVTGDAFDDEAFGDLFDDFA